jgi:eukaryotic-like serine/threonine-protein kinase
MRLSPRQTPNNRCRIARLFGQTIMGKRVSGLHTWGRITAYGIFSVTLVLSSALLSSCKAGPDLTPATNLETAAIATTGHPASIDTPTPASPSPTNTSPPPTDTAEPTSLPTGIPEVDMVLIEAGEFLMGSTDADQDAESDEMPQHKVYLGAYYIDQTEVTNAMYQACVDAGACTPPDQTKSSTHADYFGNPDFDAYPVIFINWNQAVSYCHWRKARLPTEAEWEKAARGPDGRLYPWGEEVDCTRANYGGASGCLGDTAMVGSYPDGASPYGLLDMSGNVWEWVNDWYLDIYYQDAPFKYPKGPSSGERRIARGGSWNTPASLMRGANRQYFTPSISNGYLGLRCARSQ